MPIVNTVMTYQDLQKLFGAHYKMPSEIVMNCSEVVYRCPYIPLCPARANCFVTATPEPLQDEDILSVKCRLCGNKKIPIYAKDAAINK